jgi:Na+/proline symporter
MAIEIPAVRGGMKANDFIYPIFMLTEVPHLLKGLLVVAILSAAMSSVSSALTSLASVSTMDLLKPLVPGRDETFYLRFSKLSTLGWAALLIFVAYLSREVVFVFNAAFSLRGLTSGALLGGILLAVYSRTGRSLPVVIGMITALLIMLAIEVLPKWELTRDLWMSAVHTEIFWPWYTLIGTVICISATLLLRWLMRR